MTNDSNTPNNVNNPHDRFFKAVFTLRAVAYGFLKRFLPEDVLEKVDLETLELETTSYVTDNLSAFYADLVWRCQFKKGNRQKETGFIFEHKSYKPTYPHFQLWDYKRGAWQTQLSTKQNLISMVPFLLYHGQEVWKMESFDSYFGEIEPEMLRFMPCFDIILIDLQNYSDEEIKKMYPIFLQKIFLAFKHAWDTDYFKSHIAELWLADYENFEDEETSFFIRAFGVYLAAISGVSRAEIKKQVTQFNNNLKSKAMTFIEEFIEEGIEKGIEKEKKDTIIRSWQNGISIPMIANIVGLSVAEVEKTIAEYQKK